MTWFKVDDQFWGHPKQTALPKGAVALWVRAGSWSANLLTNGFVPAHMVAMLGCSKGDANALVKAGLWHNVDGGYQFHDWSEYQPTREQVEHKRDEEAKRKAEWRAKRAAQKAAEATRPEDVPDMSQRDNRVSPASVPDVSRSSRPDPTRPDPDSPNGESSVGRARKRATATPDGIEITAQMRTWAVENAPAVALTVETEKFLDHHRAKGSLFKEWPAAWRTWMRNAQQYAERDGRGNVRQLALVAGEQPALTRDQIENLIGPDGWQLPPPPDGLLDGDPAEYRRWARKTTEEHHAARVQAALAKLRGTA